MIRNLLTAIASGLRLAENNWDDPTKLRTYLAETKIAIDGGIALTSQLLAFSRHQSLEPHVGNVNEYLHTFEPLRRRTGHRPKLVRQVTRGERTDIFRIRQSSLEAHLPMLDEIWSAGYRNGAEPWRRLKAKGFRGSLRVVGEWTTRRRAERTSEQQLRKVPSAKTVARLMTTARDHLSKSDTVTIAAIETGMPMLVAARILIDRLQTMIRMKAASDLDAWITEARASLVASFASAITRDRATVRAAITEPWSNG